MSDATILPSYSGWTNYPSWCCNLWLDNEPGSYERALEIVREADDDREAEAELRGYCEWLCLGDEPPAGIAGDLLPWALALVDWTELVAVRREQLREGA